MSESHTRAGQSSMFILAEYGPQGSPIVSAGRVGTGCWAFHEQISFAIRNFD